MTGGRRATSHSNDVCDLELQLLDPKVRADRAAVDRILHPHFEEIGSSGRVWTREATVAGLAVHPGARVEVQGMVAHEITPGATLVTYTSDRGNIRSLRSSLWIRDSGRW